MPDFRILQSTPSQVASASSRAGSGLIARETAACADRARTETSPCSVTAVHVVNPNDVVLAEIAASLYLDQFERDSARISQAVHRADRDVDRLVFVHHPDILADRHFGGAAHDDPVLSAMMMLLK